MSEPLFHLAEPDVWEASRAQGTYTASTLGRTLEQEGFIHASYAHQWPATRQRFYGGVTSDLLLLEIDPERLEPEVVPEVGDPSTGERFPHLYGPLNVDAVVSVRRLPPPHA